MDSPADITGFVTANNFARLLETLGGFTFYKCNTRIWTSEPDRFIVKPIFQTRELNT